MSLFEQAFHQRFHKLPATKTDRQAMPMIYFQHQIQRKMAARTIQYWFRTIRIRPSFQRSRRRVTFVSPKKGVVVVATSTSRLLSSPELTISGSRSQSSNGVTCLSGSSNTTATAKSYKSPHGALFRTNCSSIRYSFNETTFFTAMDNESSSQTVDCSVRTDDAIIMKKNKKDEIMPCPDGYGFIDTVCQTGTHKTPMRSNSGQL